MKTIKIFDTTLRDGEQSPGASMNIEEKVKIATQLEKLGVDVIEAGFAAASPGDFEAISKIAKRVQNSRICSLARAVDNDIVKAAEAIKDARYQRIHTFIATSKIHMENKLKMSEQEVIKRAVAAVKLARSYCEDVEFSCEDAGRSETRFLKEVMDAVIEAGATTINLPDTVGYRMPHEIGAMIEELVAHADGRAVISVHNHNDLGLAVANSLSAIENGAMQVECTINGLGERAGNAALEEIVMTLKTRADIYGQYQTNINTKEIYPTSRLVSSITGIVPQPNKAIVGKNAFAHESGIHQDGVLKCQQTYEIMSAADIGMENDNIILGKHSGKHAFKTKLKKMGYELEDKELLELFEKFKALADSKKEVFDDDLRALLNAQMNFEPVFELTSMQLSDCSAAMATAAVELSKKGSSIKAAGIGNGTIDAVFKTIDEASGYKGVLKDYQVQAVSQGKDALAKVVTQVIFDDTKPAVIGRGLDLDTMKASAQSYVNALNSYLSMKDSLGVRLDLHSEDKI
ncbi:MAG: 2-isopropylmalate synthase [Campylobacterota bacterium]